MIGQGIEFDGTQIILTPAQKEILWREIQETQTKGLTIDGTIVDEKANGEVLVCVRCIRKGNQSLWTRPIVLHVQKGN